MQKSEQSNFESDLKGETKILSNTMKCARAMISSAKTVSKHARGVLASALWPPSTPEQWCRGNYAKQCRGGGAFECCRIRKSQLDLSSSNDFERQMASKHARAMISTAHWLPSKPEQLIFNRLLEKTTPGRWIRVLSNTKKLDRARISSAQRLPSMAEQWFRAQSTP